MKLGEIKNGSLHLMFCNRYLIFPVITAAILLMLFGTPPVEEIKETEQRTRFSAATNIVLTPYTDLIQSVIAKNSHNVGNPKILDKASLRESFGKLPLSFEVNQGQTSSPVRFLSRGSGYNLFLTPTETVLTVTGSKAKGKSKKANARTPASSAVLRMKFAGANPAPQMVGLDELPGKNNYFIGNDPAKWHTDVSNYAKVKYESVYPGVDLVYYGNQRQLEYDFIVAPGADHSAIRLSIQGARKVLVDKSGDLVLRTKVADVRWQKPIIYQEINGNRTAVEGSYKLLADANVAFNIGSYDHSLPLVIDPVLVYSSFLGGSGDESPFLNNIAVDSAGNAYVVGGTSSINFPTAGAYQNAKAGGTSDVFITKINSAGSAIVYSTYLGGSLEDIRGGITVDSTGNAYVAGDTTSTNFPTTAGAYQTTRGAAVSGFNDAFITKLNPQGNALVYSTYLGGNGGEGANGIAVDTAGNAYVSGQAFGGTFPTVNAFQATRTDDYMAFVSKLNPTGTSLLYSTFLGGNNDTYGALSIATDNSGNAYVTGTTSATNFPSSGAFQTHGGGFDAYVTKLNTTASGAASLAYSSYLGGSAADTGYGIDLDTSGNAYVTGVTSSTNFPTTSPLQAANGGGGDAFVAKINPAGSAKVYSTYVGGSGSDSALGIAVDGPGNAYITGNTTSTNFPSVNPSQPTNGGGQDAFVAKLNAAGSALAYSTYLGGSGSDSGQAIAVDTSGNAYVFGSTASTNFPLAGPFQPAYGGGASDVFITKLGEVAAPPNNDFGSCQALTGAVGIATGTNVGSSKQTGEPNHGGNAGGKSVWYCWTAPASGPAYFNTLGSDFDTLLGVYTGSSVNALTLVGDSDNFTDGGVGYVQSQVRFTAVQGTVYYIAVDGKNGVTGNITLRWGISGATGCVVPPANMVSWWPGDGNANDIRGPNNGTLQGGATAAATGRVGQAFSFNGTSGHVALGNPASLKISGAISIDAWINPSGVPANGTLAAIMTKWAQTTGGGSTADSYGLWVVNRSGTLRLFSALNFTSGSEPNIEGGTIPLNTWSHVAMTWDPATGRYAIYINGEQVATQTHAGSTLLATDRSVSIGKEESFLTRFFPGLIDEVEIFTRALAQSEVQSIFNAGPAGKCKPGFVPPNNDFENAEVVSGAVGTARGTNLGANKQASEPNHGSNAGGKSVWYRWTAPTTGPAFFNTLGSDFDTLLGVYTGSSVGALTLIGGNDDFIEAGVGYVQSQVTFNAVAGTVYYIGVDGKNGEIGNITLNWGVSTATPTPTPQTTPTPAPGTAIYRINSGGPDVAPFNADNFVTGGATFSTAATVNTSGVINPAPAAVYQTDRFGNFTYTFPGLIPGATYTARLHFAETFHTSPGVRAFNVAINGNPALSSFDIFADAGGANKAVVKEFVTTANGSGQIVIVYTPFIDNPKSNGIEIIAGGTPGVTPTPTPTPTPPANAIRALPGCTTNTLPATDDGSSTAVTLPFPINYFGTTRTQTFVNTNGNITFTGPRGAFTPPVSLTETNTPIIAPFYADVDTRGAGSGLTQYGSDSVDGRQAFCVNWVNVGYFSSHADKLNSFQLILIDRSDTGAGNFDIEFNFDRVVWETGDSSGGTSGLGGNSARSGYANGSMEPGTFFELAGSAVNGGLLDTNMPTGLTNNSLNSGVLGRYIFAARSGAVPTPTPAPSGGRIAFSSLRDGQFEVYSMNPDGTDQRNLSNNPAADLLPDFSGDGSRIAFTSSRDGNNEIYVMNADGTLPRNLTMSPTDDGSPNFSNADGRITFRSRRSSNDDIYVMDGEGNGLVRLTTDAAFDGQPAFSPLGDRIAFVSSRDGNNEIYVMNAGGGPQTRLTNNPAADGDPTFSPDGRIFFSSNRDGNEEIYEMSAEGTGQRRVLERPGLDLNPTVSPDGGRIAFSALPPTGELQIFVMNENGTMPVNISNNGSFNSHPSWGPAGGATNATPTPTPTPVPTPGGGCFVPPASLANWYPGQGNPNDSRGTANGTPTGNVTYTAGKVGQAFAFDGNVNAYVTLPTLPLTLPPPALGQSFSLEFWINPGRGGAFQHVVSNAWDDANFGALYMENNKLSYWNRGRVLDSLADIPLNQWTHAALVYNGSVVRLYVNGVLDRESNQQGITFNTPVRLADDMGRDTERTFQGLLDEVSFYNGALTAADVQAIFNAGGQGKCTGTTTTPTPTPTPVPGTCPTFSNSTSIAIPATGTSGNALPYPSNIMATGATGTVSKVVVKLNGLTHQFPDDIDMLLVGPGGQNAIIMSDADSDDPGGGITLTLDDAAANPIPDTGELTTGTYRPTNYGSGDTFPAPAPVPAGGSALSVFNGTDPNGTWSLYIVDDGGGDTGSLTSGWELQVTTTTCGTPSPTPLPTLTPIPTPTPIPPSGNRRIVFDRSPANAAQLGDIFLMNEDGTNQVQLTSNAGTNLLPVWSPDATKIAFVSDRDEPGNFEIYVMDADGGNQRRLTTSPGWDVHPSWSPDGSKIAFAADPGMTISFDIFVINAADGTARTKLTTNPGEDFAPDWSPDGTKIAFSSVRDGAPSRIYVMDPNGDAQTRLNESTTSDRSPAWSPDGSRIAFTTERNVAVMNANGTGVNVLTNYDSGTVVDPAWSPNGDRLAFGSSDGTNSTTLMDIWMINPDGTGLVRITDDPGFDRYCHWKPGNAASPTPTPGPGEKIVFHSDRNLNNEIYVTNSDGTGLTRLTTNAASDTDPVFSPDLTKILFASNRDGNYELYVMNADGTVPTRLTSNTSNETEPAFSPDGNRILFLSDRDGNREIYVMNADGTGQVVRVTNVVFDALHPVFSPDGRRIAYSTGNEIYIVNDDGTAQMQLTNNGGFVADWDPAFSPDGTRIAFTSSGTSGISLSLDIFTMKVDGTDVRQVTPVEGGDNLEPTYSRDGSRIAYVSNRDNIFGGGQGEMNLYLIDPDGTNLTRATNGFFNDRNPNFGPPVAAPNPTPTPTPSGMTISGRVFTPTGLGLRNAIVTLIDAQNNQRRATTSSFGVYSFENVPLGTGYFLTVSSKRFRFAPRSLEVNGSMANVDFTGLE